MCECECAMVITLANSKTKNNNAKNIGFLATTLDIAHGSLTP